MRYIYLFAAIVLSFAAGAAYTRYMAKAAAPDVPRATGIGGIFFKVRDPAKTRAWYQRHLGLRMDAYGTSFEWREGADSSRYGFTQWSAFRSTTKYFGDSTQDFMINYRVNDLEALLQRFKAEGVSLADTLQATGYGKFIHVVDGDGRRIELWEPVDTAYDKVAKGRTR